MYMLLTLFFLELSSCAYSYYIITMSCLVHLYEEMMRLFFVFHELAVRVLASSGTFVFALCFVFLPGSVVVPN